MQRSWTGVLGDADVELVKQGVITNAELTLNPHAYTHAHHTISRLENFTAINSAIEVDLIGQVNTESARGRYDGATGGLVDFVRGATR